MNFPRRSIHFIGDLNHTICISRASQKLGDFLVESRDPRLRVDGEQHNGCTFNCRKNLCFDIGSERRQIFASVVESFSFGHIDSEATSVAYLGDARQGICFIGVIWWIDGDDGRNPIASHTRGWVDNGYAFASKPIKQTGLAHIGATDDSDDWQH